MSDTYLDVNQAAWTGMAPQYAIAAERLWPLDEPSWGIFGAPESQVGMFPSDVQGWDVVELGCGTAYVSAWLARRGANPKGIDLTPAQLDTARAMQEKHGIRFPLVQGNAEQTPFADESADFVISEYGASIWCDPYKWIPEAHRLLRPGGLLRFLRNHPLTFVCSSDDPDAPIAEHLCRPYFGLYRLDWGTEGQEFTLTHGAMIDLLLQTGFEIEGLVEIQVPENAETEYPYVTGHWANRWPSEEVWKARKRA